MLPPAAAVSAPARVYSGLRLSLPSKTAALALLLALGFALLLYRFPSVPAGLNQDEMSEAYESFSLLHTGADRWGYHLPVYFLGWGSGQNVMQAYATVPVVAVLGLTRVSARFIPLLCGLLSLPLFFLTLRRWFDEDTALLGLFLLVLCPWHIMFSRWGVENSPLPFVLLLGVYTFGKALQTRSPWLILPSLLPFAVALYTYGVVIVVLPFLLFLLFFIDPTSILKQGRAWLGALALFFVAAFPIFFFTLKNYITKRNYGFERHVPFSVPLLPVSRLAQIHQESGGETLLKHNLHFLRQGLADGFPWNQIHGIPPIPLIVLVFALVGAAFVLTQILRTRRLHEPFLLCALACLPLFFVMPMDMARATALYIPLLALAAIGARAAFASPRLRQYRMALAAIVLVLFLIPTVRFVRTYYGPVYAAQLTYWNNPELPDALARTLATAGPSMPVYVSGSINLNYVQVLFLTQTDPSTFQHAGTAYNHPDFGRYRFSRATLATTPRPIAYLIKLGDDPVCSAPISTQKIGQFELGICR